MTVLLILCLLTALYPQNRTGQSVLSGFSGEDFFFDDHRSGDSFLDDTETEIGTNPAELINKNRQEHIKREQDTDTPPSVDAESGKTAKQLPGSQPDSPLGEMRNHSYFFRYVHTMQQGARFAAGAAGRGYIGYLQLESPMPMPYFELSIKNFGAGLYPFAGLQAAMPDKNIPTFFIGAGCLHFGRLLKVTGNVGFSTLKPKYSGLRFPEKHFIGMGSSERAVQYGVELYGGGWNAAFFASPEKKKGRMRYGILGSWHISQKQPKIKCALQYLTAFIPDIEQVVSQENTQGAQMPAEDSPINKQRYHKLFALNLLLMHPIVSVETTGLCSYAADKTVSGGIRTEANLFYRCCGLNGGVSYTARQYRGWAVFKERAQFTGFIQPYIQMNIFSLHTIYTIAMEEKNKLHSGGLVMQVKHKNVRWLASWEYGKELHTVKTGLALISSESWFRSIRWFEKALIGTTVNIENKTKNPFMLKKYTVNAASSFCITEGVFCGISGDISQSIVQNRERTAEIGYTYLQNPVCRSTVFLSFKRNGLGNVHSGKLELSVKNEKPFVNIKIAYQIQNR